MPLMMSSVLRLHLDRRFCFRQPGKAIAAISGRVQRDPLAIEIDSTDALPPIEQQFYETSSKGKIPLLQRLLSLHQPSSCVVFCNTKKDCQGCLRRAE